MPVHPISKAPKLETDADFIRECKRLNPTFTLTTEKGVVWSRVTVDGKLLELGMSCKGIGVVMARNRVLFAAYQNLRMRAGYCPVCGVKSKHAPGCSWRGWRFAETKGAT